MRISPRLLLCFVLGLLSVLGLVLAQHLPEELAPAVHARVVAGPIDEMSGIVKSRRHEDLYWVHNDSGDSARIFAIDSQGRSILPTFSRFTRYGDAAEEGKTQWEGFEVLNADNVDWEDMAVDERYLYIADTGNNLNIRRNLAIYAVSEIDPTASTRSAVVQKWPVIYPEQTQYPPREKHYDSESLFVDDGTLYLITKHRKNGFSGNLERGAWLYRLDTRYTERHNVLTRIDGNPAIDGATGAELSPDGSMLAVIATTELWLFERPAEGDQWLSAPSRHMPLNRAAVRQVEAVTWFDDTTLLVTNEGRDMFLIGIDEVAMHE